MNDAKSSKYAVIRYAETSRQNCREPIYKIDLSPFPDKSSETLTYSEMVNEAKQLISEGWELRFHS